MTRLPAPVDKARTVATLLADGVPLTLLLDLAAAVPSRDLYRNEVAGTSWVRRSVA